MKHQLTLLLLLWATLSQAQTPLTDYWNKLHPDWWLIYDKVDPLNNNRALVQRDLRYGLVDTTGKELLPIIYNQISFIDDGLICILKRNDQMGVCNLDGKIVVPLKYRNITSNGKAIFAFNLHTCTRFTLAGTELINPAFSKLLIRNEGSDGYFEASSDGVFWGLVDSTGKWAVKPQYTRFSYLRDGCYQAYLGKKAQLMRPRQQWQGESWYADIVSLSSKGYWAKTPGNDELYRCYNWQEQPVPNTPAFDTAYEIGDYLLYSKDHKYGLLDSSNNVLIAGYDDLDMLISYGHLPKEAWHKQLFVAGNNGKKGVFNGSKWIIPQQYTRLVGQGDKIIAMGSGYTTVFDRRGNILETLDLPDAVSEYGICVDSPSRPDSVWHITNGWLKTPKGTTEVEEDLDTGYLLLTDDQYHYTYMSPEGQVVIDGCDSRPYQYRRGPYIIYSKHELFGWYSKDSSFAQSPIYEEVHYLSKGAFLVRMNLHWGVVDRFGKTLIPIEYEDMTRNTIGNVIALQQKGKWYPFYATGQPMGNLNFTKIIVLSDGFFWAKTDNNEWICYSPAGKKVSPIPATDLDNMKEGAYVTKYNGKFGQINLDGEISIPFEWDTLVGQGKTWYGVKGDSVTIFADGITVPGKSAEVFNEIGYTAGEPGKWNLYDKNGKKIIEETLISQPLDIPQAAVFWAHTGPKQWIKADYFGKKITTIVADTLIFYGNDTDFMLVKKDSESYVTNFISGQKWPQWFDEIDLFARHQYMVNKDGKFGLVDGQFHEIAPTIYQNIHMMNNINFMMDDEYYVVMDDWKTGLINRTGQVCIPVDTFDTKFVFSNAEKDMITAIKNGLMGYYSTVLQQWFPPTMQDIKSCYLRIPVSKRYFLFKTNGLYGIMDENCREVLPPRYMDIASSERLIILTTEQGKSLWDPVTNNIIATGFSEAQPLNDYILCQKGNLYSVYCQDSLVFTKEALSITWGPEDMLLFTDMISGKKGLINTKGDIAIPAIYDTIEEARFHTLFAKKAGKTGLIDMNGKVIIPFDFTDYFYDERSDFVQFNKGQLVGLYSFDGQEILPPVYSQIELSSNFDNSGFYFIAQKNGKYQYYNNKGQVLIPGAWEEVRAIRYGLAAVKSGGKWGYININGETVVPFQFRYASEFESNINGLNAVVIKDTHYQTIDRDGKVTADRFTGNGYLSLLDTTIKSRCEQSGLITDGFECRGYMVAGDTISKKYGIMNRLGEFAITPQYDEIEIVNYGKDAIASMRKGRLWGLINYSCEVMIEPQYDELTPPSYDKPGLYRVRKGGESFVINEKGEKQ